MKLVKQENYNLTPEKPFLINEMELLIEALECHSLFR